MPELMPISVLSTIIARLVVVALVVLVTCGPGSAQNSQSSISSPLRERLLMDRDWRFSLGNAGDPNSKAAAGVYIFDYLAKAGTASGVASSSFDDHNWRMVNLPNDWAVELPFNERGSASHGYKAIGVNFPEHSHGWYRKTFSIPASDLGKHITIEFDGVYRDSQVWVNGFYLGREPSGYSSFSYNLTDYLNYGGTNTIAVHVDASQEEGWFYEGAGIYRHVWLVKSSPVHVAKWGTFVSTETKDDSADITARVNVENDSSENSSFTINQSIQDAGGKVVASTNSQSQPYSLKAGSTKEFVSQLKVREPKLWSTESPYMYKLVTSIQQDNNLVDRYETPFGIRSVRWDANRGFLLNGKRVELKGTCNHQDHAGVGVALPDAVNVFRLKQLKEMGCNAVRTSHNAPTPELLDACDRLGMLVMDENREYGINPQQLEQLRRLIVRDRNHPSVIIWSLGNEEGSVEGNDKGTRITQTMQTFAHRLDDSRPCTVAISGGWGKGSSLSIDVMGFNYYTHGNNDEFHKNFPKKTCVATEDASTLCTRGVYVEDKAHQHLTAYDVNKPDWGLLAEESWTHYAACPYVAGLFQWTGLDYRGEPTPFNWPAISTQFGILDTCGFPKDNFYYYQSWWSDHPVLHVFPHWNWKGKEGQDIDVWVYSNCEEVELFLNDKSLGRKRMTPNSHLQWSVNYEPGTLLARGYRGGKEILTDRVETTTEAANVIMTPDRMALQADGQDVSMIKVQVVDSKSRPVPTADNEITFSITGPGRIIGVGNGDPSSHEPDQYLSSESSQANTTFAKVWKRHLFNGLAQVILQSTGQPGEITVTATAPHISSAVVKVQTH